MTRLDSCSQTLIFLQEALEFLQVPALFYHQTHLISIQKLVDLHCFRLCLLGLDLEQVRVPKLTYGAARVIN
jgi:hypothetical protein